MENPQLIEKKSFNIISKQLGNHNFSKTELPVITRVIHATADFDFAKNIVFSAKAIKTAITAITDGCSIVTDVNMVKIGIKSTIVKKFGGNIICNIADKDVFRKAESNNITRAIVNIRKSQNFINNGIIVIGNSPTALHEVIRLVENKKIFPKLIIGVPVGFVEAEESKLKLLSLSSVPFITNKGKKGGTPTAVAIINALLLMADETLQ